MKGSPFPPDMINGLTAVLDELGDKPLIVRSSSLLEDRAGTAFSGKYKSLFLANQGTKKERLSALTDAIAEVYASVFGPDPIEYRAERGLLEFNEEMGILIQEVVGVKAGRFFMPSFAGVAFSRTEFRWSPRIQREDGLVRLVPGLGTRAVDRVRDDYPVLAVPGQAGPAGQRRRRRDRPLRAAQDRRDQPRDQHVSRPWSVDDAAARDRATTIPASRQVFSILEDDDRCAARWGCWRSGAGRARGHLRRPASATRPSSSRWTRCCRSWSEKLGTPVDIEFAHDGEHLYLLQCRAQSQSDDGRAGADPPGPPAATTSSSPPTATSPTAGCRTSVTWSTSRRQPTGRWPPVSRCNGWRGRWAP